MLQHVNFGFCICITGLSGLLVAIAYLLRLQQVLAFKLSLFLLFLNSPRIVVVFAAITFISTFLSVSSQALYLSVNIVGKFLLQGVTAVLNFQSGTEAENWGISVKSINDSCQRNNILMINYPIR